MYEITFNVPDAGLLPAADDLGEPLGDDMNDTLVVAVPGADDEGAAVGRRYPPQARRSVIGNQPYDTYAPHNFSPAGDSASAQECSRGQQTGKDDQGVVDDTTHRVDPEMCTRSEDKLGVMAYLMTQYNLKPGLQKFGSRGQTAAVKELPQLHIMDTWTPMAADKLSREQRMRALSSLLFLKEKRTGDIKGRACINGAPQRAYIPKEDAASSTVSTESTFITATIAASEGRRVRCYNVPSAFVNTDVDEDMIMVLKGELADMMTQIAPEIYRKYITVDRKGTRILYVKLQKALYGLMRASLLFYHKLRKELEQYGFVINPYDPCVANMETKSGKQLTVVWHVDGLMGSCEDDFELTKFSCYMGKLYGPKMSMHLGKKHDYLGVDMEFCDDGALEVSMIDYLKNVIMISQS